jgi:hypothetical protein
MRWFGVTLALLAVGLPAAACGQGAAEAQEQMGLRLRPFVSGLDSPTYVTAPRGEPGKLYVVEQDGLILVVQNGKVRTQPFLDIRRLVRSGGEQGLLSVAFHPNYAKNDRFFVYFNDKSGDVRVFEYRSNGTVGLPGTAKSLLRVPHREFDNHDGGQLQFGPDGRLYAGTGDGGSGGDPPNNSQNLSRRLGKLLRLNGSRWQVYAYGLRNPWRFSFDRANGDLYIGDVGQGSWEEIDYRPHSATGLANYGWSAYEGLISYNLSRLNPSGTLVKPVQVYSHNGGNCSVTGGYVYRGSAVPSARGRYFYGDYCTGEIWSLRISDGRAADNRRESSRIASLTSFGQGANGTLYAVSLDGGLYRLSG